MRSERYPQLCDVPVKVLRFDAIIPLYRQCICFDLYSMILSRGCIHLPARSAIRMVRAGHLQVSDWLVLVQEHTPGVQSKSLSAISGAR